MLKGQLGGQKESEGVDMWLDPEHRPNGQKVFETGKNKICQEYLRPYVSPKSSEQKSKYVFLLK